MRMTAGDSACMRAPFQSMPQASKPRFLRARVRRALPQKTSSTKGTLNSVSKTPSKDHSHCDEEHAAGAGDCRGACAAADGSGSDALDLVAVDLGRVDGGDLDRSAWPGLVGLLTLAGGDGMTGLHSSMPGQGTQAAAQGPGPGAMLWAPEVESGQREGVEEACGHTPWKAPGGPEAEEEER